MIDFEKNKIIVDCEMEKKTIPCKNNLLVCWMGQYFGKVKTKDGYFGIVLWHGATAPDIINCEFLDVCRDGISWVKLISHSNNAI